MNRMIKFLRACLCGKVEEGNFKEVIGIVGPRKSSSTWSCWRKDLVE
jgi:hypothetical protein